MRRNWTAEIQVRFRRKVMRTRRLELEKVLTRKALAEPHRTCATAEGTKEVQIRILGQALMKFVMKELLIS
jgi:hypothetical protein